MRIAFLTFEVPDVRPGGVGAYVFKCAAALAAIGHEPHIFTLAVPESVRRGLPAGVHLHEVPDLAARVAGGALSAALAASAAGGGGGPAAYKLLVGALLCDAVRTTHADKRFDLVEAAECEALVLPMLLRPAPNLPVVVQIHLGFAADAAGNAAAPGQRDHLAEALELASIVGADSVCAATQNVVDVTRRLCPFDRPVEVIPYPVRIDDQAPAPPRFHRPGAVLFVGRLQRRKGCDIFAGAANLFLRRVSSATIRFAGADTTTGSGGGSMLEEMVSRVEPDLRDRFIYLGELSQARVRDELASCRFQVVPSVIENFANTAIDAMAAGRLVIYGGNTGLDEVVGDAGLRVWPLTPQTLADAMTQAWHDPALISDAGRRAFERARTVFDPAAISRKRIAYYQRVISEHQAGRQPRQWDALSGPEIHAVLGALVGQMQSAAGLSPGAPTPGAHLANHLSALRDRLDRTPVVWLFGAGRYTQRLLGERDRWESLGLSLAGIIDDHPRFQSTPTYLGLPVRSPDALHQSIEADERVDAIYLSTDTLEKVFRERTRSFADRGIAILAPSA